MNEQSHPDKKSPPAKRRIPKWLAAVLGVFLLFILAGILLPLGVRRGPAARAVAAKALISVLGTALGAYQTDNGHYPSGANGLLCLIQSPLGAPNWRGPYINPPSIPKDPWGHAFIYECPGQHNPQSYDLSAVAPDGMVYGNWVQK